jgi:hypothetical protein
LGEIKTPSPWMIESDLEATQKGLNSRMAPWPTSHPFISSSLAIFSANSFSRIPVSHFGVCSEVMFRSDTPVR